MRGIRKKKGQSTLEYVAIFSVVVLAIVAAVYTAIEPGVTSIITNAGTKITAEAAKMIVE